MKTVILFCKTNFSKKLVILGNFYNKLSLILIFVVVTMNVLKKTFLTNKTLIKI